MRTHRQTLEDIYNRKYFPSFYLERPDVDSVTYYLAQSAGKALLLIGEAGSGKSSLLARLAERLCGAAIGPSGWELPGEGDEGIAYLSGRADFGGTANASGDQLLADAIARKLGIREGGESRAFASMADLALHLQVESCKDSLPNRPIWLLLDGINEADRFLDLVRAVDIFLPNLASLPNLRLAVSMPLGRILPCRRGMRCWARTAATSS